MNELDFALDTKAIDDEGHIEGLAAGYGNVDHGGDLILPGAIGKGMRGRKSVPMLLYHDMKRPVGVWNEFQETEQGLSVKGKFSLLSSEGREAYTLTKDGALSALSIGYNVIKEKAVDGIRQISELLLHEVSLVTIGMNAKAQIRRVKEIEDILTKLRAGDRLQEREWESLFKKQFELSNAEAERAVRINLKGRGDLGGTASGADFAQRLHAALVG